MHHTTVLLKEAIDALIIDADGFYVDGTFGRGGHSRKILDSISKDGELLALDKDYGFNFVSSGPLYKKHEAEGEFLYVDFDSKGCSILQ